MTAVMQSVGAPHNSFIPLVSGTNYHYPIYYRNVNYVHFSFQNVYNSGFKYRATLESGSESIGLHNVGS